MFIPSWETEAANKKKKIRLADNRKSVPVLYEERIA